MSSTDWAPRMRMLFESFEHNHIGEKIHLKKDELRVLTLPNGVEIRFEQIIALAGDFYGLPKHPIIDPSIGDDQEDSGRHKRFQDAHNTLARAPKEELQQELDKLLAALKEETEDGRALPAKKWDEITGGKWLSGVPVKEGRMLLLAENNHDHFLPYAKTAYLTGHQLAIDKAREASKFVQDAEQGKKLLHKAFSMDAFPNHLAREASKFVQDAEQGKKLLHEAFSMDAFACHFLTDSFASGHIRTPRVELGKGTALGKDGHLLSKYMHDEDNKYGLRVTNLRGDKWIAYGDGTLLKEESKDNLRIAVEVVQRSVDQVYEAYKDPTKTLDLAEVSDLMPFVDQNEINNSPLFQVKDGKLHRRSNINDLQDRKTISNWWGPTTVAAMLTSYKPGNSAI